MTSIPPKDQNNSDGADNEALTGGAGGSDYATRDFANYTEPTYNQSFWTKAPFGVKVGTAAVGVAILVFGMGYLKSSIQHGISPAKTGAILADQEEIESRTPVEAFELTDLDGRQHSSSEFSGHVVILSFWASWCAPCLVELPTFAELMKRFGERGLRIVPVNVDEGDEGKTFSRDFWKNKGFQFPNLFDAEKNLAAKLGVDTLPATFVLDKKSRIVFTGVGANDWANPQTLEIVEGLLDEPN